MGPTHVAMRSTLHHRDVEVGSDTKCYGLNQYAKSPKTDGTHQIKSYNNLGP